MKDKEQRVGQRKGERGGEEGEVERRGAGYCQMVLNIAIETRLPTDLGRCYISNTIM